MTASMKTARDGGRAGSGQIAAVVFDLGGVLIDWDPRYLYRRLLDGNQAAVEVFLAEVCTPEWNARQDAGRPWEEAVAELSARRPEARDLIETFDQRWEEMLGGPVEGSVELLEELRAGGLPLYALSNWSAAKFPIVRARYPFLGWFDDVVISGEVGLLKPDPAIYRLLLDRHGLVPRRTLYVDDAGPNVDAAHQLGMRALPFRDAGSLRAELAALGLLESSPVEARPTP